MLALPFMKRIAYYGGSFDPVHLGHLRIADKLSDLFELDEFVFIPAFHAPHKTRSKPTSAYHRFAMLCLATRDRPNVSVSKMELEVPEKPYTFESLTKIQKKNPKDEIFFVMGADSWEEITTWKEWEKVLTIANIIVVTRPGFEIVFSHVTDEIRERIVDKRMDRSKTNDQTPKTTSIFITDAVRIDISSTAIRKAVREDKTGWNKLVSSEVAKYIKKYNLYTS